MFSAKINEHFFCFGFIYAHVILFCPSNKTMSRDLEFRIAWIGRDWKSRRVINILGIIQLKRQIINYQFEVIRSRDCGVPAFDLWNSDSAPLILTNCLRSCRNDNDQAVTWQCNGDRRGVSIVTSKVSLKCTMRTCCWNIKTAPVETVTVSLPMVSWLLRVDHHCNERPSGLWRQQ